MTTINQTNGNFEWRSLSGSSDGPSFSRKIYLSSGSAFSRRWVAKLVTGRELCSKRITMHSHGDEISYKVSKAFHWRVVPKTKTLHQSAFDDEKICK